MNGESRGKLEEILVLMEVTVGRASEVAWRAGSIPGVVAADAVGGPYDVVVRAHAADLDGFKPILAALHAIDGVTRATACFVVRAGVHREHAPSAWAVDTPAPARG